MAPADDEFDGPELRFTSRSRTLRPLSDRETSAPECDAVLPSFELEDAELWELDDGELLELLLLEEPDDELELPPPLLWEALELDELPE